MESCMRVVLVILNIVLLVFAVIMIGVGIWIVVEFPAFNRVLDNAIITSSVWITVVVGIVLIIICLLAFVGAVSSNKTVLGVYSVLQITIFILEVLAAGFIFYVGTASVHGYLANEANTTLVMYGSDDKLTLSWDTLNKKAECCGVTGPDDYQYTVWHADSGDMYSYPDSCCVLATDGSEQISDRTKCHNSVEGYYFAELVSIIAACAVCCMA
ncbi:tetraspanin-18B-like isoform X2 [Glandiceps talaboti]